MTKGNFWEKPWIVFTIIIVIAAWYTQSSTFYIQPDLDGGLVWALNDFFSFRQTDVFTYPHSNGPLYFLKTPSEKGDHLVIALLFDFFTKIVLGYFLFQLARLKNKSTLISIPVFIFLLSVLNSDFIIIAAVLASSYYTFLSKKILPYLPSLILVSCGIFMKGSISFPCLALLISLLLTLCYQGNFKRAAQLALLQAGIFFILCCILYSNPLEGLQWTFQSVIASISYGSNQAIYFHNFPLLLIPALLFILAGPLWIKDKQYHIFYFMTILLVIIFWKYVLGRQDFPHYSAWYYLCFLFVGFSFILFETKTFKKAAMLYFLSFTFFLTNAKKGDSPKTIAINTPHVTSFLSGVLKAKKAKQFFSEKSNELNQASILSDTMLSIIGQQSVDVFPWQLSILRKYNLNYAPRPNFISTLLGEQADKSDSIHFASEAAPQYVLWHNSGNLLYQLGAHDQIYLPNTASKAIASLYQNYDYQLYENGFALWSKKKSTATSSIEKKSTIESKEIELNEWFTPPTFDSNHSFYGQSKFELSITDKIRKAVYQGRFFKIVYKLKNEKIAWHFVSLHSLQKHFLLQPYFTNPSLDYEIVSEIKIEPMSEKFQNQKIKIEWQKDIPLKRLKSTQ
jgi:hypothetical protein